jgi:hypothetical protein
MSRRRQHRAWAMIVASAVLVTLLLALLPHSHLLTVSTACPVLAIVFLFGTVYVPCSLWLLSQENVEYPPQSIHLPSRSQRPPPASI